MAYLYETHMHTCTGSACGRSTGAEHVHYYKDWGYQGIILTDHFFGGNTAVPRSLPWEERVNLFCKGYEEALNEGLKCGLDVFFAWEQKFDDDEFLVYGLDKAWLLEHPEVEHWTRREQYREVHRYGGCVVQAHPFRARAYIQKLYFPYDCIDGVEVYNACNDPYSDAYALAYAKKHNLAMTAGSDNHHSANFDPKRVMGVLLPEKLTSIADYVRIILNREPIGYSIPPHWTDGVTFDTAPILLGNTLDENENPVPCNYDYLRDKMLY